MSQKEAEQEPTMEEILASIRRIISEDEVAPPADADVEEEAELVAEPAFESEPEFDAEPEPELEAEDVLELTEVVEDEPVEAPADAEVDGDLVIFDDEDEPEPEPAPAPRPVVTPAPAPVARAAVMPDPIEMEDLVSEPVAAAATSAFGSLLSNMMIAQRPGEGLTLEALVRELLKPMLKDWLDANLANIVEAKVEDEVARLAGRARR